MHPDTQYRFYREHLQALLDEAEALRRVPVRPPTLRPRLARWLRALARRLDHLDPAPVMVASASKPCRQGERHVTAVTRRGPRAGLKPVFPEQEAMRMICPHQEGAA